MRAWFEALQPRERNMVIAGAVAAALVIFWGFIWMPLRDGVVELRDAVGGKQQLVADMRRAEALEPGASVGGVSASSDQSLVVLVDSTAQSLGLAGTFTRTRPNGTDEISVSFQNASFDTLVTWLIGLERTYGVSVDSASFNGTRDAGLVSGQIFLRRL